MEGHGDSPRGETLGVSDGRLCRLYDKICSKMNTQRRMRSLLAFRGLIMQLSIMVYANLMWFSS